MKALLKNLKGINYEVLINDINAHELPTLRHLIETRGELELGMCFNMSRWSDSNDYIVTRYGKNKIELSPVNYITL